MRPSISSKRFFVCPKSRITAAEALNHPYLAGYQEELLAEELQNEAFTAPLMPISERCLTSFGWQSKVMELIALFNKETPRELGDSAMRNQEDSWAPRFPLIR
jgi:hypothetical protein